MNFKTDPKVCHPKIFSDGHQVDMLAISSKIAQLHVPELNEREDGYAYDFHMCCGRARILRIFSEEIAEYEDKETEPE